MVCSIAHNCVIVKSIHRFRVVMLVVAGRRLFKSVVKSQWRPIWRMRMEILSLQPIQNCTLFYFVFYSTSGVLVFEMINLLSTLQKCFVIGKRCKDWSKTYVSLFSVYCACCLGNHNIENRLTDRHITPHFYVNVADIETLETEMAYIACTYVC